MKKCGLCGAEISEGTRECPRCGFEFQREILADSRDRGLLERHAGKDAEVVRRELRENRAKLAAYLDDVRSRSLCPEELAALADESLKALQIPLVMGPEDDLRLDKAEAEFIGIVSRCLDNVDTQTGRPVGSETAYVKLGNALMALGRHADAVKTVEKAILINPRNRDALYCMAKLLFEMKRYGAAKKYLAKLDASGDSGHARYLSELIDQLDCQPR